MVMVWQGDNKQGTEMKACCKFGLLVGLGNALRSVLNG
jgi:hypothetical protein